MARKTTSTKVGERLKRDRDTAALAAVACLRDVVEGLAQSVGKARGCLVDLDKKEEKYSRFLIEQAKQ